MLKQNDDGKKSM